MSLDDEYVFVVSVWHPLVPDLDLGKVEAAGLGHGAAATGQTHGAKRPHESAVDLTGSEGRHETPDVLKRKNKNTDYFSSSGIPCSQSSCDPRSMQQGLK